MIGDGTNAVDRYACLVGAAEVSRVKEKARTLSGRRIQHINATKHGGGVAEILLSLIPLARSLGVDARWSAIKGEPNYFEVTKRIHNLLQGGEGDLSEAEWQLYMSGAVCNADIVDPGAEFVVVHDPQPLHLIGGRIDRIRWIWRCHLDLTETNQSLWRRLMPMVDRYDHTIFSLPDYSWPPSTPSRPRTGSCRPTNAACIYAATASRPTCRSSPRSRASIPGRIRLA